MGNLQFISKALEFYHQLITVPHLSHTLAKHLNLGSSSHSGKHLRTHLTLVMCLSFMSYDLSIHPEVSRCLNSLLNGDQLVYQGPLYLFSLLFAMFSGQRAKFYRR